MNLSIRRVGVPLLLGLALAGAAAADGIETRTVVVTDRGSVAGQRREDGVTVFMGIPYAQADRWRPPRPAEAWEAVRDAGSPAPSCPQDTSRFDASAGTGIDENCLFANVYAGELGQGGKRPVMVWIHGGSFRWGTGADPLYDGKRFVDAGMVLVTFNYRLGRFGRFAHPALSRAQAGEPLGNYALMDQIAALEWVQRNAAAFGGDPQQVTIFGCSAGGVSVVALMATPSSGGLFQRAISQSGGIVEVNAQRLAEDRPFAPALEADGLRMARKFGIEDDANAAARLRALPMQDIIAHDASEFGNSMNPVVDGKVLPDDIGVIFDRGRQHAVPLLIGSADWEDSLLGRASIPPGIILAPVKDDLDDFRAAYGGATDDVLAHCWFRDGAFLAPTRLLADRMGRVGRPGYVYQLRYVSEQDRGQVPGAAHCSETPYVFGTYAERSFRGKTYRYSDQDRAFGRLLGDIWIAFARDGRPSAAGLPDWPAFRFGTADRMMQLDAEPRIVERYQPAVTDYYRQRTERMLDLAGR